MGFLQQQITVLQLFGIGMAIVPLFEFDNCSSFAASAVKSY